MIGQAKPLQKIDLASIQVIPPTNAERPGRALNRILKIELCRADLIDKTRRTNLV